MSELGRPSLARPQDADPAADREIIFAPEVPLRHLDVDGARIAYRVWEDHAPNAPGLLFVHGFRAHARWWDHIIPYFTPRYRVAAIDLSGCGDSEWRDNYTLAGFARDILGVVHAAQLAPVTIVAHSFGGSPTACACSFEPSVIKRAIIIDSRLFLRDIPKPQPHELAHINLEKKSYPDLQSLLMRYRLIPTSGPVAPQLLQHIALHSTQQYEDGWSWKFDPLLHPELPEDAARDIAADLVTPIDYIYGDESDVVNPELVDIITKSLPTCGKPVVIPECNHHVLLEQPISLVSALRALLAREAITWI